MKLEKFEIGGIFHFKGKIITKVDLKEISLIQGIKPKKIYIDHTIPKVKYSKSKR